MDNILKYGSCSIILGKNYYKGYFPEKKNKLLKVSSVNDKHDDVKNLLYVRKIKNYEKYFCIPDEEIKIIDSDELFYQKLEKYIMKGKDIDIFNNSLQIMYIDYGGDSDLLESINFMFNRNYSPIWNSTQSILKFAEHIMEGLSFLHHHKICHLDIKPENIMINHFKKKFKIIDFGFSSLEPFDDFISNIKGTPGYFPKHIEGIISPGLPKIEANDMIQIDGVLPFIKNRKYIYKIDSFCLGRVLNILYYVYNENKQENYCIFRRTTNHIKIKKLISLLTENDVNKRQTITTILSNFKYL